jgi:hypothetical protein
MAADLRLVRGGLSSLRERTGVFGDPAQIFINQGKEERERERERERASRLRIIFEESGRHVERTRH